MSLAKADALTLWTRVYFTYEEYDEEAVFFSTPCSRTHLYIQIERPFRAHTSPSRRKRTNPFQSNLRFLSTKLHATAMTATATKTTKAAINFLPLKMR